MQHALALAHRLMPVFLSFASLLLAWLATPPLAFARTTPAPEITPIESPIPRLPGEPAPFTPVAKTLEDTVWIADWSFDLPNGGCTSEGWVHYDNRILNDGRHYWQVNNSLSGTFPITGNAAILRNHDLSWVRDGFGDNWDQSLILKYRRGTASDPVPRLSCDLLTDCDTEDDFITIEADSGGESEARVDYNVDPSATSSEFRVYVWSFGPTPRWDQLRAVPLPDFGAPGVTHEVYIRLRSDGGYSDEDGNYPTPWNSPLVVDNIVVTGNLAYSEDFEGVLNPNVTFANTLPERPFGLWSRLYPHITDNDACNENLTCAWLVTDPQRLAISPSMGFGPGSAVVRNWLDDIIVSPWVSLISLPPAQGTILSFRRFPGNLFANSKIVQGWRVRSKVRYNNTDTSVPGDSVDLVTPWDFGFYNTLNTFGWVTSAFDMTSRLNPRTLEFQVGFRVGDWQYIGFDTPPVTFNPGPGPYTDRIRIGRRILSGPVINIGTDPRTQAQDCFPTVQNSIPGGQHFSPAPSDIFGTCAFSQSGDLGLNNSPNLITGDSIWVESITDARQAGGITAVRWYGAITAGPHTGKAPPPYVAGGNGFFEVTPDSARVWWGPVVAGRWFVDFDDTYFRGGDRLQYFWSAIDAAGGRTSAPDGITQSNFPPVSVIVAELATGGLFEFNALPAINWDPTYLAAIQADLHGDLDPSPAQIANSSQRSCILYYQHVQVSRRSGETNRTSFMYTLDRLGYRGYYDVYDVQGYGNTNNQLGGRATVAQCTRYALIIEDDGRSALVPNIPDGTNRNTHKINQSQWYRDYLAQGVTGLAGRATFWLLGEDTAFLSAVHPLVTVNMGLTALVNNQGLGVNPDVVGTSGFSFQDGCSVGFTGDRFALQGGCVPIRAYDGASTAGTAVATHRYAMGSTTGGAAVVMNANASSRWNTVWMGFGWFDIRDAAGATPSPRPEELLAGKILGCALPPACVQAPGTTGTPLPEIAVPATTALHPNIPNPFNPATTIRFDLAHDGWVELRIYDVAGKVVRTLVAAPMERGYGRSAIWDGLDESGRRASSGVYFYRLSAGDFTLTRKMVMLK